MSSERLGKRPVTAPSRMPSIVLRDYPEEDENPIGVPLCRKVACMNITIVDNAKNNIVEALHCVSSVPSDPNIFRFEVVDIFARIKENCLEQQASNEYHIPLEHICITILYPTMVKPLYTLTKRINGMLMAEMAGAKHRPDMTLRDLIQHNQLDPDIFTVATSDDKVLSMNTDLEDLQVLMNQYPKKYKLSINIMPNKTSFFAKIYYRHKDEPELEEHDFFTEYRVTTVGHASTVDHGKAITISKNENPAKPGSEAGRAQPQSASQTKPVENSSVNKDAARNEGRQESEHSGSYSDEDELEADDAPDGFWDPVPPDNGSVAPPGPGLTTPGENDFLAGGDNKYSAIYQQGFAVDEEYEIYEEDEDDGQEAE